MVAIAWDQIGDRVYEGGVDKGVLYVPGGVGVPWNGLLSVIENTSTSVEPIYFDGIKQNDIVTAGDFSATLRAYTYPDEFLQFEGTVEDQSGMFVTGQQARTFHLCYRTKIGNDVDGMDTHYKIHLLWNLIAVPSSKTYETMSLDSEPSEFEWSITSTPEEVERYSPTAHIILDSRTMDPWLLLDIESILYGDELRTPTIPSLKGLTNYIRKWERIIIIDNGDGTWTATTQFPELIEMLDATTFQINDANATYLDADTYEITSSDKNEEDIF